MNKNMERLAIGGGALVLGLLLGWMVRGVTTYNAATESTTPYDDWRTYCPPAKIDGASCEMMGDVVDPNLKATVARISIIKDAKAPKDKPNAEIIAFTLPLPPIPLQREFARRVTAVEALKTAQRASLAELDALFATLQHRAFKGEL